MKLLFSLLILFLPGTTLGNPFIGTGSQEKKDSDVSHTCNVARLKAYKDITLQAFGVGVESKLYDECIDSTENKKHPSCKTEMTTELQYQGAISRIIDAHENFDGKICTSVVIAEVKSTSPFYVRVQGKNDYVSGENVYFDIETTSSAYIYIFVKHDKHVELIFPKEVSNLNFMRKKGTFPFYENEFKVWSEKKGTSKKTFIFLFSKQKIGFNNKMMLNYEYEELVNHIPSTIKRVVEKNIYIRR